jgi:hypothetical protein
MKFDSTIQNRIQIHERLNSHFGVNSLAFSAIGGFRNLKFDDFDFDLSVLLKFFIALIAKD